MKVQIRANGSKLSKRQLVAAEKRAQLALARFGERIERALLSFHAVAGPRKGHHILCKVDVRMRPKRVRAECADADVTVAVAAAIARAVRSIALALDVDGGWNW